MKNYETYEGLTDQEKRAVIESLKNLGYFDIAEDEEAISRWYNDDTITINKCRSGRCVAYILTSEEKESAVYVDTLQELTTEEIEKELY